MISEIEGEYDRLQTQFSDATHDLTQIAQDRGVSIEHVFSNRDTNEERESKLESLPPEILAALKRRDESSTLAYAAAKNLARSLVGQGESLENIAGRLGTTSASVKDMLSTGGDSVG
jgi:hypothetical protein